MQNDITERSAEKKTDKNLLLFFLMLPVLPSLAEVRSIMTTAVILMSGGNQGQAAHQMAHLSTRCQ